ncbi:hypothetical protein GNF82_18995, partial [Clostridium perfringens]
MTWCSQIWRRLGSLRKGKQALLCDFGVEHSSLLFPTQVPLFEPVNATPECELHQFMLGGMTAPLMELYDSERINGLVAATVRRVWGDREFPDYEQIHLYIG